MADNITLKESDGTLVSVASDEVTSLNGSTLTSFIQVERVKVGSGADGVFNDASAATPLPTVDATVHGDLAELVVLHTDLAAVLARLSADPATQTTLAAVLAKLSGDPATQTTLAAVLAKLSGDPSTGANQSSANTKLDTLHSDLGHLTDGQLKLQPATATTFADAGTIAAANYRGITIKNTSTTATAEIAVRQANVSGTILDTITLAGNESAREHYPSGRTTGGTIYMQVVSGAVTGSVFSS